MRNLTTIATLIVLSYMPAEILADTADLLIPVPEHEVARLRASGPPVLDRRLYFAKRQKIVTVAADLLQTADKIRIPLFGDDELILHRVDLRWNSDKSAFTWEGKIEGAVRLVEQFIGQGFHPKMAEQLDRELSVVTITGAIVDYDSTSETASPTFMRDHNSAYQDKLTEPIMHLGASISTLLIDTQYVLRPLDSNPRYHVFFEVDHTKTFYPSYHGEQTDPENEVKRQQYRDFLDAFESPHRSPP